MDTDSRPRLTEIVERVGKIIQEEIARDRELTNDEFVAVFLDPAGDSALAIAAKIDGLCDDAQSIASSLRHIAEHMARANRLKEAELELLRHHR